MAEYRNAEGYADPTAYEAFRSIEKEEKKCFFDDYGFR